jgi:hypothetical protein
MEPLMRFSQKIALTLFLTSSAVAAFAAILPEERVDVLYHRYDGGGIKVDGPSLLVRKNFAETVSVSANYYVDKVSSASIDVVTQASPFGYSEDRTETSVGVDYLYDRTLLSAGYTKSDEDDYTAETLRFDISQEFFGDLTTVSMGYSRANDEVRQNGNAAFEETVDRQHYRLGLSQIVTRDLIVSAGYELITDEGYLNNPYRSVRYLASPTAYAFEAERYPHTRTSDALALRALYYLPYRAALRGEYKYYKDDWEIEANSFEISYTHPLPKGFMLDVRYRLYQQDKAEFYSDLYARQDFQNYLARDKELSSFDATTLGVGISYEFLSGGKSKWMDRGTVNLFWDRLQFDYDDYRDIRVKGVAPGSEPLYSFDADVIRFFLSVWF